MAATGFWLTLFWISYIVAIYSYFIYPCIIYLLPKRQNFCQPKQSETNPISPSLRYSVIVSAHNEAHRIRDKIHNLLELKAVRSDLEIIITSDASTDDTHVIVESFEDQGVRLVANPNHEGKEMAQKLAIEAATGDVLIFNDPSTKMDINALATLDQYFSQPEVGAVSSEDRFVSQDGQTQGEGLYVKYEMWLRQLESQLSSLIGLSGSLFAARKEVCESWDTHSPSDFNTALNCIEKGFVAISAPDFLGYVPDIKDPSKQYFRKYRTILRGITAVARRKSILNLSTYGVFAWQVFSHKVMRWAVPWGLIGLLFSSVALMDQHWIYALAFYKQVLFYGLVIAAYFKPNLRENKWIKICYFFVEVNVATLHATVHFWQGKRMTTWAPSQR